jgi:hypothetical protein
MRAFILNTRTVIEPFKDDVGDARILNSSLRDIQRDVLRRLGFEAVPVDTVDEIDSEEFLLLEDSLYATERCVREFLKECRKRGGTWTLGLKDSLFVKQTMPLQDMPGGDGMVRYPMTWVSKSGYDKKEPFNASVLPVDPMEKVHRVEFPEHYFRRQSLEFPATAIRALRIQHWIHIFWANYFALFGLGREMKDNGKFFILKALLRAHSFNRWKVLSKLVKKGRGCDIHPTAVIEGSILGDGVRIGAHALVRGCVVGNEVTIRDKAVVELSVLGDQSFVHTKVTIMACVLYPGAIAGHRLMQYCLLGNRVNTTGGGYVIDFNFRGEAKVEHKGKLVPVGSNFIGSCFGHDVVMGTGLWINSGRAIPNGYFLVMPPGNIVSRIPKDLPKGVPLTVRDGGLEPLRQ